MFNFLSETRQCVVLNAQASTRTSVTAEVPQSSMLCPLLIFIYINISLGLPGNASLFEDDASFFFLVIHDSQTSGNVTRIYK